MSLINGRVSLGRRAFALAAAPTALVIAVTDVRGKSFPGVAVGIDGPGGDAGTTDSDGLVRLQYPDVPSQSEIVLVAVDPAGNNQRLRLSSAFAAGQVTTFRFATEAPVPLVTLTEGIAFGAGLLMALFGFYKDGTTGNIVGGLGSTVMVSAVASSVRRHL